MYTYMFICIIVREFTSGQGDRGFISGWVIPKTQKMVLDASLHNTLHYKLWINDKWSNPEKEVAPFLIPRCCSYWKGNLRVALDYDQTFSVLLKYKYMYVNFYTCKCINVSVHIYVHVHVYVWIHIYEHFTCVWTYTNTQLYIFMFIYIYTIVCQYICIYMYVYICMYAHSCVNIYNHV